jgi:hypothetical protein
MTWLRRMLARLRAVLHRFWINPESEQTRISQIDWYRPGGE